MVGREDGSEPRVRSGEGRVEGEIEAIGGRGDES